MTTIAFYVERARYAKGMLAVRPRDDVDGFKGRTSRLCCALRGRWSNREGAYIMSPTKVEKLKKLYDEGWDACNFTATLVAP